MSRKSDDERAERIEEVAALARDRLAADDAERLETFIRRYFAHAPAEDLLGANVLDLYGAALAHLNLARSRSDPEPTIRVYTPQFDEDGWQSTHTIVEVVELDMPFLVDSIRMELNRHGLAVHLLIHPVMKVHRDESGQLSKLLDDDADEDGGDGAWEAFVHAEVDRQSDPAILEDLAHDLRRVLSDVRAAVEDWPLMIDRLHQLVGELHEEPAPVPVEDLTEATAFLEWIGDDHFTFLGYREYDLVTIDGQDALHSRPATGLGILRQKSAVPVAESFAKMPPEVRQLARTPELLNITKANSVATVHRASHLDYFGIKRFDASGQVTGECRFLGLYTSNVYNTSPTDIPVLRRKVALVLERAGFPDGSHSGKDLQAILETYPRDELFQISDDELFDNAMGILQLQDRQRVALFVQRDRFGRFFSCLVFVPREALQHRDPTGHAGDPPGGVPRGERGVHRVGVGVAARPTPRGHPHRARRDDRLRRGGGRTATGRCRALMGRRPPRRPRRAVRRRPRHPALPPLPRGVPPRVPRRLRGAAGRHRHRAVGTPGAR